METLTDIARQPLPTTMPRDNFDLEDHVVNTVDHNTGGPQRDRIRANKVVLHLAVHGNQDATEVRQAIDQAVEDGRLERDEDSVWLA